MAKWLIPALLIATGACLFGGGLVYGVVTVGVPTQDATPEVAAREARDVGRSGVLMAAGLVTGAVGMAMLAVVAVVWAARRRVADAESGTIADDGHGA